MIKSLKYVLFCLLIALMSCQSTVPEVLPTAMPTQAFLPHVNPEHGQRISYEEYKARLQADRLDLRMTGLICVYYVASEVLEYGDDGFGAKDYLSRSELIINEEVWPSNQEPIISLDYLGLIESKTGSNEVGPYDFCWDVELEPGVHTIEFKTRTTSGKELSYSWSFTITE